MDIGSFPHQVTRLVFDTGQPYEEFRARYEAAVPALDEKRRAEARPDKPRSANERPEESQRSAP